MDTLTLPSTSPTGIRWDPERPRDPCERRGKGKSQGAQPESRNHQYLSAEKEKNKILPHVQE